MFLISSFHIVLLDGGSDAIVTGYSKHNEVLKRRNRDAKDVQRERGSIFQENSGQRLKDKVEALVEWCIDEEDDGLLNLRNEEDHFMTFVDVCLVHLANPPSWNMVTEKKLSNIFSPSDEAIAMLTFENHVDDFDRMIGNKNDIGRKDSRPRYTKEKGGNTEGGFKGWHIDGVNRFNVLIKGVKTKRNEINSVRLEKKVMNQYRDFCNMVDKNQRGEGDHESMDLMPGIDLNKYLVEPDVDNWTSV